MINDIGTEMAQFKELAKVPREQVRNFRNDMYVVSEAIALDAEIRQAELHPARCGRRSKNYKSSR